MFNTTNVIKSSTEINVPEKIELNITNDGGFFVTHKRGSKEYSILLSEDPYLITRKLVKIDPELLQYHREAVRMDGGIYQDHKVPVKVLSINYAGNDEFIFNLVKIN